MNLKITLKRKDKCQFHTSRELFHEECTVQRKFSEAFSLSLESIEKLDIMKVTHVTWDRSSGYFYVCAEVPFGVY